MTEALKAVNARIDEQTDANRKAFADQKLVIDTLANDLRVIREKVDDNNVRVGSLGQELDALRQSVAAARQRRAPAPAPSRRDGAAPPTAATAAAARRRPAPPRRRVAAEAAGRRAWPITTPGSTTWRSSASSPTSRPSRSRRQADDAQVHIGNSYLQTGKNDKAVEAYDTAIRNYPTRQRASPTPYSKKGIALKTTSKQPDTGARSVRVSSIKNYPDSVGRPTVAQQRLRRCTLVARRNA